MVKQVPDADAFPRPIATVDVVPLRLRPAGLEIGTILRETEPYRGRRALIGGFIHVDEDEDVEATARRVLLAKADAWPSHMEQLAVFSGSWRDRRGWSLSVTFVAVFVEEAAPGVTFEPAAEVRGLPFDHDRIVAAAVDRVRTKAGYSSLPLRFLAEPFTVPEAHAVYQTLLGAALDRAAFRRKILESGFLQPTGDARPPSRDAARPARLYRVAPGQPLHYVPRNFGS